MQKILPFLLPHFSTDIVRCKNVQSKLVNFKLQIFSFPLFSIVIYESFIKIFMKIFIDFFLIFKYILVMKNRILAVSAKNCG